MNARLATVAACILASACTPADRVNVEQAWSPAVPPTAPAAAVYMNLSTGAQDVLLTAATPIAERVEFHRSFQEGGLMRMRAVNALELPAGEIVHLQPGGLHMMLLGLRSRPAPGEHFTLSLQFRDADPVSVEVEVRAPGDTPHTH